MNTPTDLIKSKEAIALLGVQKQKYTALLKSNTLRAYTSPLDKRVKYVSRAEVLALKNTFEAVSR